MNDSQQFDGNKSDYDANGYSTNGYSSQDSLSGYQSNGYGSPKSEPYGVPDYFANGYQENIFEGSLNLADTPWTETIANPNPQFNSAVKDPPSYSHSSAMGEFDCNDLE